MDKKLLVIVLICVFVISTNSFPNKSKYDTDILRCLHVGSAIQKNLSYFQCRARTVTQFLECKYELRFQKYGYFKCRKNRAENKRTFVKSTDIQIMCSCNQSQSAINNFYEGHFKHKCSSNFQLVCKDKKIFKRDKNGKSLRQSNSVQMKESPASKKLTFQKEDVSYSRGSRFKREIYPTTVSVNKVDIVTSESQTLYHTNAGHSTVTTIDKETTGQGKSTNARPSTVNSIVKQTGQVKSTLLTSDSSILEVTTFVTDVTTGSRLGMNSPNKKSSSTTAIVVGILVPVIIIAIVGLVVYRWYRKKYPVRMIIGKNFSTHHNPVYTKKTNTLSLVRESSMDTIEKGTDEHDGFDNPGLDYAEMQPTNVLSLSGVTDTVTDLDDEPPVAKPRKKKKARISVTSTESVDSHIMSTFLQDALDEVDSEADDLGDTDRRKISVDLNLTKNMSKVSVESEASVNSNSDYDDNADYENIEVFNRVKDEGVIQEDDESDDRQNKAQPESSDEDRYDDFQMGNRDVESGSTSDEYDIVNVDESDKMNPETEQPTDVQDNKINVDANNIDMTLQEYEIMNNHDTVTIDVNVISENEPELSNGGEQSLNKNKLTMNADDFCTNFDENATISFKNNEITVSPDQTFFTNALEHIHQDDKLETSTLQVDNKTLPSHIKISYKTNDSDESSSCSESSESLSLKNNLPKENTDTEIKVSKIANNGMKVPKDERFETKTPQSNSPWNEFENNDPFAQDHGQMNTFHQDTQPFSSADLDTNTDLSADDFIASDPFTSVFNAESSKVDSEDMDWTKINTTDHENQPPLPVTAPPEMQSFEVPSNLPDFGSNVNGFGTANFGEVFDSRHSDFVLTDSTIPSNGIVLKSSPLGSSLNESFEKIDVSDDDNMVSSQENTSLIDSGSENDCTPPPTPSMPPPPIQNIPSDVFTIHSSKTHENSSASANQDLTFFQVDKDKDEEYNVVLTDEDLLRVTSEPEQGLTGDSNTSSDVELSLSDDSDSAKHTHDFENTTESKNKSNMLSTENSKTAIHPSVKFSSDEPSDGGKTIIRPSMHFANSDTDTDSSV